MALPTSGTISLDQIGSFFGIASGNEVQMANLYRGGPLVPGTRTKVPVSGAIGFADFYTVATPPAFSLQAVTGTNIVMSSVGAITGTVSSTAIGALSVALASALTTTEGALTYAVSSGSLPSGFSLNTSTGLLSASNITSALSGSFTITATNQSGGVGTVGSFTVNITASFSTFTFSTVVTGGQEYAGPSLASLKSLYAGQSWVNSFTLYNNTPGYQMWPIPAQGTYQITAASASGGRGNNGNNAGAQGGIVRCSFTVSSSGYYFIMIVGHAGVEFASTSGGGAGGGTFVCLYDGSTVTPLLIAGGGAGAGVNASATNAGSTIQTPPTASTGGATTYFPGGAATGAGFNGAGFYQDGGAPNGGWGGRSFANGFTGFAGGNNGGFGGGGCGWNTGSVGTGGGGGGWKGGNGGVRYLPGDCGTHYVNTSYGGYVSPASFLGNTSGNGYVTITAIGYAV